MGLMTVATPLKWEEAKQHVEHVKEHAVAQFLAIYGDHAQRQDDPSELRWGEEIEYMIVEFDEGESVRLLLRADEALRRLEQRSYPCEDPTLSAAWRTEFGNHMLEGVTSPPYLAGLDEVLKVEPALRFRRKEVLSAALDLAAAGCRAAALTLTAFPNLGVEGAAAPAGPATPQRDDGLGSRSCFVPDEVIAPHVRYLTLTANIRSRKGLKPAALLPCLGEKAPEDVEQAPWRVSDVQEPVKGCIYMDCPAFGAGNCCTQATFSAPCLADARRLYDQLLVLAPLFLPLTAAAPFFKGRVADTDTRASAFAQTWDDRTQEELTTLRGSRAFTSPLVFLADAGPLLEKEVLYNDVEPHCHAPSLQRLRDSGLDERLARHVACLFARDPLVVFRERLSLDDKAEGDHWEGLQSTNWGTVRFKPPPARSCNKDGKIGWRVELRTPEMQPTDFENAAIVCVARVLAQLALKEGWDLYMPISKVEENLRRSEAKGAVTEGRFWWRADFLGAGDQGSLGEFSLRDIFFREAFGVFARCEAFVRQLRSQGDCSQETLELLLRYFELFRRRASGELPTPAALFRKLLTEHPDYEGGCELPGPFVRELLLLLERMGKGESEAAKLLCGDLL